MQYNTAATALELYASLPLQYIYITLLLFFCFVAVPMDAAACYFKALLLPKRRRNWNRGRRALSEKREKEGTHKYTTLGTIQCRLGALFRDPISFFSVVVLLFLLLCLPHAVICSWLLLYASLPLPYIHFSIPFLFCFGTPAYILDVNL